MGWAYLQERIQNNLRHAAFVDVSSFEEHLGRSFSYPPGYDKGTATGTMLLGRRRLYADTQIRSSGMTLVQIRECLQMVFSGLWTI